MSIALVYRFDVIYRQYYRKGFYRKEEQKKVVQRKMNNRCRHIHIHRENGNAIRRIIKIWFSTFVHQIFVAFDESKQEKNGTLPVHTYLNSGFDR